MDAGEGIEKRRRMAKKMYAKPRKAIQKLKKVRRKFRKALSYRGKMKQGIH